MDLNAIRPSGIRRYTELAREVQDCVMLTIGEPDFETPQPIRAAAVRALEAGKTHYAPNGGLPVLRRAIAAHETMSGYPCGERQVLVTVGATGALFTALMGILNPGDELVVPMPAFPLYEMIAAAAGAVAVPLDLTETGFQIERRVLEGVLTPKTKAIILNSPNNPAGTVLSSESFEAVRAAVGQREIYVVLDEVYSALSEISPPRETFPYTLLCQSFSKTYAMTGWRVGYLVGPEELIQKLIPLSAAQIASVPTFVQEACLTALETDTWYMAQAYAQRRAYVCGRLEGMGLDFPEPKGAFYVFPSIASLGLDSHTFCTRLISEAGVAAVPGACFGAEGYIRISCACAMEELEKGMDRLEAFIRKL